MTFRLAPRKRCRAFASRRVVHGATGVIAAALALSTGIAAGASIADGPSSSSREDRPSSTSMQAPATMPTRPRIGLVLGGGGAKGAAHVGVLTLLEDLRVPVDCVVGTSMGALVGGTYASGMTAAEVEEYWVGPPN